jgi:hypothetical protein
MTNLLRLLRELVWPVTARPRSDSNVDAYLRPVLLLAIALLAGPDLFAVVEATTLLDLLGATLFLTAFVVWHRMVAARWLAALHRVLVPAECDALFKIPGRPSAAVFGGLFVAAHGVRVLMACLAPYMVLAALSK